MTSLKWKRKNCLATRPNVLSAFDESEQQLSTSDEGQKQSSSSKIKTSFSKKQRTTCSEMPLLAKDAVNSNLELMKEVYRNI